MEQESGTWGGGGGDSPSWSSDEGAMTPDHHRWIIALLSREAGVGVGGDRLLGG